MRVQLRAGGEGWRIADLSSPITPGGAVRAGLGGKVIGTITAVEPTESGVIVTMEIDDAHRALFESDFLNPDHFSIHTSDVDLEFHARGMRPADDLPSLR